MKNKVLSVGEILLRLSTPDLLQLRQAKSFDVYCGGGEFNVAASLANFGIPSAFMTRMTDNDLGEEILHYVKSFGIDTSRIVFGSERTGLYFAETGYSKRPSKIIYDRKDSAFSKIALDQFNKDTLFNGIEWLHISGITPAVSEQTYAFTKEIMALARAKGVKISFDINWRSSLWSLSQAIERFSELIQGADLCNGISPIALDYGAEELKGLRPNTLEWYRAVCRQMATRYKIKRIAFTSRDSYSMNENLVQCFYYEARHDKLCSTQQTTISIVDRIGSGDAFTAGILYGVLTGMAAQDLLEFADACFVLKHTIRGDVNTLSLKDVMSYAENKTKAVKIIR